MKWSIMKLIDLNLKIRRRKSCGTIMESLNRTSKYPSFQQEQNTDAIVSALESWQTQKEKLEVTNT